jgi:hypothetical protein
MCAGMKAKLEKARKLHAAGMEPSGAGSTAGPPMEPSGAASTAR